MRLRDLAASGCDTDILKREGWSMNHRRTDRLTREEGLSIQPEVPRHTRGEPAPAKTGPRWADLTNSRVDVHSPTMARRAPMRVMTSWAARPENHYQPGSQVSIWAYQVVETLEDFVQARGRPKRLRVDNVPYQERIAT
jgi:putative transposase